MLQCFNASIKCENVRMWECENARMWECENARMWECENARMLQWFNALMIQLWWDTTSIVAMIHILSRLV